MADACQSRKARIDALLADSSHHIEFNGHLSNHNKHAVVALAGLGASAERIEEYYYQYVKETTYGFGLEPKRPSRYTVDDNNCLTLLGQRTSFSNWCEYFSAATERDGLPTILAKWMPILLPGWAGAFTHATIHLGWGLDYNHPRMIIEGLAYMAFSWVSCHPQRQTPSSLAKDATAIESLISISTMLKLDSAEYQAWAQRIQNGEIEPEKAKCHPELKRSGLQYRIAMSLAEGHPLMDAMPGWLLNEKMEQVWLQIHYIVAIIYLARPGDFVNLHLITSLYAMEQIASKLPEEQHRSVARNFWQGMMGILLSSGDFPDPQTLIHLDLRWKNNFDDVQDRDVAQQWRHIINAAIVEAEEHNPKLVYVAQKIWNRTYGLAIYREAASCFTTTPELPASFSQQADDGI
ncbi:questin oxidase family protein [Brenneria izbisi]|uniref:Questin oxidase family protein n=1 Tax=Brenneria izbisi TaxID=2939450 RepID=A0AA41XWF4_9GAMM|nr:questin oxidase family protein [Brenneria izbisi]MCV9878115.1 questin oxidase family protein [Brenneria izbisi]MCV9881321.1 questin oxidase family protein [Brenneria izbisi]